MAGFPRCVLSTTGLIPPQCAHHNESPHCAYLCGSTALSSQRSPPFSSIIHVIDSRVDSCLLLCRVSGVALNRKHLEIKTLCRVFPPQSISSKCFSFNEEYDPNIAVSLLFAPFSPVPCAVLGLTLFLLLNWL